MILLRTSILLCLASVPACQRLSVDDGGNGDGNLDGSTGTTGGGGDPDTNDPDSSNPDTGGPGDSGGPTLDCDPIAQTGCNDGEKCTVVLQAGEVGYVCVADDPAIDPLGSCEAALGSGADGCPAGYACLADESESGLCVPLCFDASDCDGGVCLPELTHGIPYCAAECSPFEGGCASPLQCRRTSERFACSFARPDDVGGQGEPCSPAEDAGCGEGFVCLPGGLVPACASDSCCTAVCDTQADNCDSPSTCNALFDAPAPGSEFIGACFVPS